MENSSGETIFFLSGFNNTQTSKHLYFSFTLLTYLFILFVNLTLIVTIFLEKVLHEPMNIFICNLCVNGIYGSAGFYPKILADLLSDTHIISYSACLTQVFVVYSFALCEFTNLTVMAYDRYVAICKPLQYHSIMIPWKVGKLVLLTWLLPFLEILTGIFLTVRLPLCGFQIDKFYCSNWEVVKLSCSESLINNLYGYIIGVSHIAQAVLIVLSYVHIIRTCVQSKTEQNKFMETCLPHVITLINFVVSLGFDVLYARYNSSNVPQAVRNILSIEYLVVPPLLNPLIYGLKLKQIRRCVFRQFNKKIRSLK